MTMTGKYKEDSEDCLPICLKYLLFLYNFFFWVAGAGVMAIGTWTLNEKRNYLSLLPSSTFAVSAYILIFAGSLVLVTGFLGCCAVVREQKAGLATLSEELKQHLNKTMMENYAEPGKDTITYSIDRLQQDFKCCGSNNSADWQYSAYILSPTSGNRLVPDSCCKTVTEACGRRDHPSNVYKVEGGCITILEQALEDHLLIIGAVGTGGACLQIWGMIFTCCLYRRIKMDQC
ncbi:tetraspanin-11 isoform X2 [Heterodontus francisci]|uniref:tetraspanin-11 isoform X2 n=1 Tax=Heterodontus francisci TaxID=7792 RepID=UPI00355B8F71